MWISKIVCLFIIYSFMGWIYESIFCTIKGRKWQNRGFLYGPVCPIYGVGAVVIAYLYELVKEQTGQEFSVWQVFLMAVVGSAVLEFVTSWVLEKLFHAVWWDYSRLPLNLQGRISLFTSLGFGVAGIVIVYWIAPYTNGIVGKVPPIWMEGLALLVTTIFVMDLTLTISALTQFERVVMQAEEEFNDKMDNVVENVSKKIASIGVSGRMVVGRVKEFRYANKYKAKVEVFVSELKKIRNK